MSSDTNMTMVEALRLTRAGRLTEATEALQRGLASADTAAADESTVAQPFGDLSHLRRSMPNSRPVRGREVPRASAGPARQGLLEDIRATLLGLPGLPDRLDLPGLPDIVNGARSPRGARSSSADAAARAAAAPGVRSATSPTPRGQEPAVTSSTFRRATLVNPCPSWSFSTAASRTHRTSRPARG